MSRAIFARQTVGGRAWFSVQTNKGALRTGMGAGSFTVTIVEPGDGANTTAAVSESSQLSGLYYFDVPSAFLVTNGVGEYAATVVINETSNPKIATTTTFGVKITEQDIDSLGIDASALEMLQFGATPAVHIDTNGGSPGTAFPLGTEWAPVNNVADALTIAGARGIARFHIHGTVTLTEAVPDWEFNGEGVEAEINVNGQDVADSEFRHLTVTGTIGTGPVRMEQCQLDGVAGFSGLASQCAFRAGTTTLAGNARFEHCSSAVPGTSTPIIDADNLVGVGLELRSYAGGVQLNNVSDASSNVSVDMTAGQIVIDASCTAGTLALRGVGRLTDNGSLTVEKSAFLSLPAIEDAVLDAALSGHVLAGTVGGAIMSAAAQGLLNCVDDNFSYVGAPDGVPSSFRRRVFVDAAAAAAATPGAPDGADGEIARFLGTAVYSGTEPTDVLQSMSLRRVA